MSAAGAIFMARESTCVPWPSQSTGSSWPSTKSFHLTSRFLRGPAEKNSDLASYPVSRMAIRTRKYE